MMTDSNIQPYRGDEPYAFISYAHRNKAEVLTIIGRRRKAAGYGMTKESILARNGRNILRSS